WTAYGWNATLGVIGFTAHTNQLTLDSSITGISSWLTTTGAFDLTGATLATTAVGVVALGATLFAAGFSNKNKANSLMNTVDKAAKQKHVYTCAPANEADVALIDDCAALGSKDACTAKKGCAWMKVHEAVRYYKKNVKETGTITKKRVLTMMRLSILMEESIKRQAMVLDPDSKAYKMLAEVQQYAENVPNDAYDVVKTGTKLAGATVLTVLQASVKHYYGYNEEWWSAAKGLVLAASVAGIGIAAGAGSLGLGALVGTAGNVTKLGAAKQVAAMGLRYLRDEGDKKLAQGMDLAVKYNKVQKDTIGGALDKISNKYEETFGAALPSTDKRKVAAALGQMQQQFEAQYAGLLQGMYTIPPEVRERLMSNVSACGKRAFKELASGKGGYLQALLKTEVEREEKGELSKLDRATLSTPSSVRAFRRRYAGLTRPGRLRALESLRRKGFASQAHDALYRELKVQELER
ncbi:MAG: hypothetical protein EB075_13655, partial [Bacteroidetes bacterium]|nr:hypothetical protein [Bacteroidota bacterium]